MLWVDSGGRPTADAHSAITMLMGARADGLNPDDYRAAALSQLAGELDSERTAADAATFEVDLSDAVLLYLQHLHYGRVVPTDAGVQLDARTKDLDIAAALRAAVQRHDVPSLTTELAPAVPFYRDLRQQLAHDRASGHDEGTLLQRTRQMELSLERLRWLPPLLGTRAIIVNVPTFELWAWSEVTQTATPDLSLAVIVGKPPSDATPVFTEEMREVVFRPYWNVPESITKGEILPALRKNPDYLTRNRMEIVDGQSDAASPVEPSDDSLARLERGELRVRQLPGPGNSLGLAKFLFPNHDNVYIHGTPSPALFKRARRDLSHGCVRVEDPVALARWVLADEVAWSDEQILEAMSGDAPKTVKVKDPVQVVLFYMTAVVKPGMTPGDGAVTFAPDVYQLDAALERALAKRAGG